MSKKKDKTKKSKITEDDLTPTQDLVMEVLAARLRLGETLWVFSSQHGKALRDLEAKGLIHVVHGVVPKTYRASMTQDGVRLYLGEGYQPPILVKMRETLAEHGVPTFIFDAMLDLVNPRSKS